MRRFALFPLLALAALLPFVGSLVAQPPKAGLRAGKKIAVLVGVNEYLNAPLGNLRFAEQDMLALKAKLETAGFTVILMLGSGKGDAEASRENLVAILIDKREENKRFAFRDVTSEDDQIVVAFSGHGQQIQVEEADDDGKAVKREVPFFCPKRAESGKPSTQVSLNEVLKTFNGGKAKALLLVDACRDFAANVEGTKGAVVDRKRIDALRPNVAGMFACSDRQRAIEHPNPVQVTDAAKAEGHGLFFYSVLEAMNHKNARDRGGNVDWDRMVGEIKDTVADKSKELFPTMLDADRQLPQGFGSFTRKFVLATAAALPPKGSPERKGSPEPKEKPGQNALPPNYTPDCTVIFKGPGAKAAAQEVQAFNAKIAAIESVVGPDGRTVTGYRIRFTRVDDGSTLGTFDVSKAVYSYAGGKGANHTMDPSKWRTNDTFAVVLKVPDGAAPQPTLVKVYGTGAIKN